MRCLFAFFKKYRVHCIIGPLFKLMEVVFELLVPLIIASIINDGILVNNVSHINKCVIVLCIFSFVGFTCTIFAQYMSAYASVNISSDIREAAFSKVLSMRMINVEKYGTSKILNNITSDINQIQLGINLVLRLLLRSPFVVIGSVVMAFTISARLSIIFLLVVVLLSIVISLNLSRSILAYGRARKELDNVVIETDDALSGVRVIRCFVQADNEYENFVKSNSRLCMLQKAASRITVILNPITFLVVNASICFLIYYGAIEISFGVLTSGAVVALYNYMSQILVELIKLTNLIVQVSRAYACSKRVTDLLEYEETTQIPSIQTDSSSYLEFKNVSFSYNSDESEAISNISFKIQKGQSLGIIGKTGSGKSTIGAIIAGLYDQTNGDIFYGSSVKPSVGYVLQKSRLFNCSIKENISLQRPGVSDEDVKWALDISCSNDFVDDMEALVEESGRNLSGGQKQRLGIARAIVDKPDIIVLDDASSSLDSITERKLISKLNSIDYDVTRIIISQKIKSVHDCDLILVLDRGIIVDSGNHDELVSKSDIYKTMFKLQTMEVLSES